MDLTLGLSLQSCARIRFSSKKFGLSVALCCFNIGRSFLILRQIYVPLIALRTFGGKLVANLKLNNEFPPIRGSNGKLYMTFPVAFAGFSGLPPPGFRAQVPRCARRRGVRADARGGARWPAPEPGIRGGAPDA